MVWTRRVNPECLSHIQFVVLVEIHRRAHEQDPQPHQMQCECAHTCRGTPTECQVCSAGTVGFARVLRKGWDYLASGNPDKHIILAHNLLTKCLAWMGRICLEKFSICPSACSVRKWWRAEYGLSISLHSIMNMSSKSISYFCMHLFCERADQLLKGQRAIKTPIFCLDR